jgi:hypothetical protein
MKRFKINITSFAKGELFGPYFVFLSAECQPPERLVPRELLFQRSGLQNTERKMITPTKSHLSGTLDIWLHGEVISYC